MSQTAADTERARESTTGPHAWRLLVFGTSAVGVHSLPSSGSVIIGRGGEAQISIDDSSVSRRHAELDLGDPLRIRDLGSFNGVSVGGRRLAREEVVSLRGGELLSLGTVAVVVQRVDAAAVHGKPRQILSHAYFETRVAEECTRAATNGAAFAVIRARAPDFAAVRDAFAEVFAPTDVVASYSPSELEALLAGEAGTQGGAVQRRIQERLGSSAIVGLAIYGRDGCDADQLIARAGPPAVEPAPGAESIVVRDEVMAQLHALARRVAASPLPVLLLGETGTGKEIFAEAIHRASSRAVKPLVRVNCAALGTYMCFRIRSYNSVGFSAWTPYTCTSTLAPPAAPSGQAAASIGGSSIRVSWWDNSSNESGFEVYNGVSTVWVGANSTSYTWTGLSPGTYMCFAIRSYNSAGFSAWTPYACTTTLTGPAAPSGQYASPISSSQIRVTWWDNSSNEGGFEVNNGVSTVWVGANSTSYTWGGLASKTYMCFRIRSYNSVGFSAWTAYTCTTTY